MRVGREANEVRQSFGFRHHLLSLHRDLQKVVERIDQKKYDAVYYEHSHQSELTQLSNLQAAVLFLEDRAFLAHRGFEFRAPLRIAKRFFLRKRPGAISTIDQQLVRIVTGRYERTLRRKVRETLLAFLVNFHRSKAQILYTYLHDSYFGYKLEGCEITSQFLFSKPATDLSIQEACFVAALLARPLPRRVFEIVELEKQFRIITPDRLVEIGYNEKLPWATFFESRHQYVLAMFPSIPKSLRTR